MNLRHLLRMSRWARNPPPVRRVVLVLAVVAACLGLAGLEWAGVLPHGLGLDPRPKPPKAQVLP
ncbi:hypothetical protein [Defluviimonas sp. SAOS-178_SWC]|uniref:hypothetical protein n=1 Tax=Defluviimonas sp. SAOS-178_SWC TaxID=3121287 RepID=UPI003221B92A